MILFIFALRGLDVAGLQAGAARMRIVSNRRPPSTSPLRATVSFTVRFWADLGPLS
jgi:hypothetical protein